MSTDLSGSLSLDELYRLLQLEDDGDGAYWGAPQTQPADRVFGGLLLAQAVVAAGRNVAGDQRPLALQAEFLRGVPTDRPLRWEVENLGDARSMSTRRATLRGADGDLFTATSRWGTVRDDLPCHEAETPAPVARPEELPDLEDRFAGVPEVPQWWRMRRPVWFRHAEPPPYVEPVPRRDSQTVWVRARGDVPADHTLRAALVAYVTDMSILESAFRALGGTRHGTGSRLLSLSHSLTFHRSADLSDWHQFDSRCRTVAHGRALASGEIFDQDGRHVASATQLGLTKIG